MRYATVEEFVKETLADLCDVVLGRTGEIPLTATLSEYLQLDEIDIVELAMEAEEELGISVSDEDEEKLFDFDATVQTVIDLFTKLYQQSNPK